MQLHTYKKIYFVLFSYANIYSYDDYMVADLTKSNFN